MENEIRELLAQLLTHYREIEAKISTMEKLGSEVERMQVTVEVNSGMSTIKNLESALTQKKERFESSGQKYSDSTRKLVDESKSVLADLIHKLKEHEELARHARQNLAPQIHSGVKVKKMHHAYTNNG